MLERTTVANGKQNRRRRHEANDESELRGDGFSALTASGPRGALHRSARVTGSEEGEQHHRQPGDPHAPDQAAQVGDTGPVHRQVDDP